MENTFSCNAAHTHRGGTTRATTLAATYGDDDADENEKDRRAEYSKIIEERAVDSYVIKRGDPLVSFELPERNFYFDKTEAN